MDYTPLMAAVSRNSKTIINILLGAQANVNAANKLGKTALMLAANKGFIDVVDILVKRGASVDAKDIHGMTALFYAVDGEFSNVVRTLVRAGACIDEVDHDNQYTPLIRLACLANNGNPRVGAALLECGANVNHQDKFGQTPLIHCAFHRNHADLAKVLLQHGADWKLKNKKMSTAMDIAKSLENTNFLQVLESFKKKK
ncbi:Fibronectin type 3 and ankyrin repeat domains protein 1 [Sparganum proliferum]